MTGYFAEEDLAVGIGLPAVYPDAAVAPARADARRDLPFVRLPRRIRDPAAQILLVAGLQRVLSGFIGEPLRRGGRAVGVVEIDHDVGGDGSRRFGDALPQAVHHGQVHPPGIRRDDHDLGLSVRQDQRRGRQVAFDRLDESFPRTEAEGPDTQWEG